MKLQSVVQVPAAPEQVWQLFLDPDRFGQVLPGCEEVHQLDETHFTAVLAVHIQFMTIRSKARGTILTAEEPRLLVGELVGEPLAMAGAFRARITLELTPVGNEQQTTEVRYTMDLTMLGRLASLGEAIVRATSQKLTRQFADNVAQLFANST